MNPNDDNVHNGLRTPRAAAVAGILFAVLFGVSQVLSWTSIPASPPTEVIRVSKTIPLILNLLPFAGIAFLWLIGVIRNRLGPLEDRFVSTVFLGSGLLYIGMIFVATATAGGIIRALSNTPEVLSPDAYALARAQIYEMMNVYALKLAGVFMISTSTIALRTAIVPRWIAILGYALAAMLFFMTGTVVWIPLVFPAWVFLLSTAILLEPQSRFAETRDIISRAPNPMR
jgi:hypothetical protein